MAILEIPPEPDQAISIITKIVEAHNKICLDFRPPPIKHTGLVVPESIAAKPGIIPPDAAEAEFAAMLAKIDSNGNNLPPRKKFVPLDAPPPSSFESQAAGVIEIKPNSNVPDQLIIAASRLNLYMLMDLFRSNRINSTLNENSTALSVPDYKSPGFAQRFSRALSQFRQSLQIEDPNTYRPR